MFSAACLILSASVLFFVLKFRVHIHVEYTPTNSGSRPRKQKGEARPSVSAPLPSARITTARRPADRSLANLGGGGHPALPVSPLFNDLVSALVNLGTPKPAAKEAAQRAMFHQDLEFETALRRAIDYASRSNAA